MDLSDLLPGDLMFVPGSDGTIQNPGPVGMYVDDGWVIEAPDTGVKLVLISTFMPIAPIRRELT